MKVYALTFEQFQPFCRAKCGKVCMLIKTIQFDECNELNCKCMQEAMEFKDVPDEDSDADLALGLPRPRSNARRHHATEVPQLIAAKLGLREEEAIAPESSFVGDLGADSLDIVEIIMAIEDEYDIEVPDEEAEKISTVGETVKYLISKGVPE